MAANLEEILTSVWRQAMTENAQAVILGDRSYPVRRTSRSRLRGVDFEFEGQMLRGLEPNSNTGSRWARLAREGKKIMQFVGDRRFIANVVDGKVRLYVVAGPRMGRTKVKLISWQVRGEAI
jgi:hypothetical protein